MIWFEAFAIFAGGVLVGFLLGVKSQNRKLTREVAVDARRVRVWLDHANEWASRWLALICVVIIVISGVTFVLTEAHHREDTRSRDSQAACFAHFANELYDSLNPRQRASERLQAADTQFKRVDQAFANALAKLLTDSLDRHASLAVERRDAVILQRTTEEKAAALKHANSVAQRLNQARSANPYPAPPKEVCPQ